MFGFLKKKLKEAAEKISNVISKPEEEKPLTKPTPSDIPEPIEPTKVIEEEVSIPEPEVKEVTPEPEVKEVTPEPEVKEKIEKPAPEVIKKEPIVPKKPKPKKKGILEKITAVVTEKKISEKEISPILEEMKLSLFESDVAVDVAETITEDLKKSLVDKSVKRGQVEEIINNSLESSLFRILNQKQIDLLQLTEEKKPLKIIFLGFNGTGKTTTIARLGKLFKDSGKKVLFAAADTWRAAAQEQLEIHGKNLGIKVIKHKYGADPAAVIFDAVKAATAREVDVVLADTAGRSHANVNLMAEMKKIVRVNKPDLKILVVDCLTGNDAVDQAKLFNDAVGIDGIIMTKADVYEKGGAVLSAAHTINKPILYIGIGQDYQDLKKFSPSEIIENLLK